MYMYMYIYMHMYMYTMYMHFYTMYTFSYAMCIHFFFNEKVSRLSWRCCIALLCLMYLNYLVMYTCSLETGAIGGLITPAFSYMLR